MLLSPVILQAFGLYSYKKKLKQNVYTKLN